MATTKKQKKSFLEFATAPKSNEGVQLTIPNTGGEKIKILGVNSDTFKRKHIEIVRGISQKAKSQKLTEEQTEQQAEKNRLELLSACVVAWSFKEPCNEANVKKMLLNAPQIADFIDAQAAKESNFLGKP